MLMMQVPYITAALIYFENDQADIVMHRNKYSSLRSYYGRGKMSKIIRLAFAVIFISTMVTDQVIAQDKEFVWTVEIIGANRLKNTDWGPNKLSDPYADIYIHTSDGDQIVKKTQVQNNTLNPRWNYKAKFSYPPGKAISSVICVLWDQDKLGDRLLGVTELNRPVPGKEYSLRLHNKKISRSSIEPGKFLMPGTLKVKVDIKYPLVKVPNIIGKTDNDAQVIMKSAGLRPERFSTWTIQDKKLLNKVANQCIKSGEDVPYGQRVCYDIGVLPTYTMPRVIGDNLKNAEERLKKFSNINVKYVAPPLDMPRKEWRRIIEQSPQEGQKGLLADSTINLVVRSPPENYKMTVPDLVGKTLNNAHRILVETNMPKFIFKLQKVVDHDKNNLIIKQEPAGGELIAWDEEKNPITLTFGFYINGKSLYGAIPTNLDEPFEDVFNIPGDTVYRSVKTTQPGYLILKNIQSPDNINPLAVYYNLHRSRGWMKGHEKNFYLPSAYRVEAGEHIVQIKPEMEESVSEKSCKFELSFFPEIDPAEPNNSVEEAVEIIGDTEMIVGFMGSYDHDVYSFQVEKPVYLEVLSKELPSESADVQGLDISYAIYNENKERVGSFYLPSASYLSPGIYFIDFKAAEGSWSLMRYKLTMRFHSAEDLGEPNDTKITAYAVDAGTTIPVAYTVNDEDFYRIKSNETGYAVLSHDVDIPFDIDFYRYDANREKTGPVVYLPAAVRVDGEQLVSLKAISEGHGYLVDPPVNLQIGFISGQEDIYEPNDTPEQAAVVELNKKVAGLLMPRNETDNYAFNVTDSGKIFFDIVKPEGEDISVKGRLLSSDGKKFIADNLYLPAEVMISDPGRYILQFAQEPGLQKFCVKQYQLTIRDGKAESSSDNRVPSERYGEEDDGDCIKLAQKAYILLTGKKYQEAKELFIQALQCTSDNAVIWNDYAVSCYQLKEIDEAEKALNKAIELKKDYALPYRNMAFLYWGKGKNEKGVQMVLKAVELDPSDENLRYAAHAYILLSDNQAMQEKKESLKTATQFYQNMKNISESSKENLEKIEQFLKQN